MCNENPQLWRVHEISRCRVIYWQTCSTVFCIVNMSKNDSITATWMLLLLPAYSRIAFSCKMPSHYNNSHAYGNFHIYTPVSKMVIRNVWQTLPYIFFVPSQFSTFLSNISLHLEPLTLIWMTLRLTFGVMESWWETLLNSCPDFDRPRGRNNYKHVLRFPLSVGRRHQTIFLL